MLFNQRLSKGYLPVPVEPKFTNRKSGFVKKKVSIHSVSRSESTNKDAEEEISPRIWSE